MSYDDPRGQTCVGAAHYIQNRCVRSIAIATVFLLLSTSANLEAKQKSPNEGCENLHYMIPSHLPLIMARLKECFSQSSWNGIPDNSTSRLLQQVCRVFCLLLSPPYSYRRNAFLQVWYRLLSGLSGNERRRGRKRRRERGGEHRMGSPAQLSRPRPTVSLSDTARYLNHWSVSYGGTKTWLVVL